MNPVLQKIIDQKKSEIDKISDYQIFSKPLYSFQSSLLSRKGSIIAECKKGSPSAGILRPDYDPVSIAREYEKAGAKAISVLTDEKFFFGSLQDLENVANSVKIPVLRKDFIIDKKQISEARYFGASAILLIVRILSPNQIIDLHAHAKSLGMDVLVEVHNEGEAKIALESGAEIIGINTRDLDTFQIYPDIIEKIAKFLPAHILIVGESGISNREEYFSMVQHVQSVLVGTYFMKKKNISEAFADLYSAIPNS